MNSRDGRREKREKEKERSDSNTSLIPILSVFSDTRTPHTQTSSDAKDERRRGRRGKRKEQANRLREKTHVRRRRRREERNNDKERERWKRKKWKWYHTHIYRDWGQQRHDTVRDATHAYEKMRWYHITHSLFSRSFHLNQCSFSRQWVERGNFPLLKFTSSSSNPSSPPCPRISVCIFSFSHPSFTHLFLLTAHQRRTRDAASMNTSGPLIRDESVKDKGMVQMGGCMCAVGVIRNPGDEWCSSRCITHLSHIRRVPKSFDRKISDAYMRWKGETGKE